LISNCICIATEFVKINYYACIDVKLYKRGIEMVSHLDIWEIEKWSVIQINERHEQWKIISCYPIIRIEYIVIFYN
jgi:hypothetical protein